MSVWLKKSNRLLLLIILLFILVIGGLATYWINKKDFVLKLRSRASGTNWPITGSFMPYISQYEDFWHQVYQDMKTIGMKTVILIIPVSTTCTPTADGSAYQFTADYYKGTSWDTFTTMINAAREEGMEVFLGDSFFADLSNEHEYSDYCDNPEKFAQTQINIWNALRTKIGPAYFDNNNFIKGFYLQEASVGSLIGLGEHPNYFKSVSGKVKTFFPGKLTMISPWPNENYGYTQAKDAATSLFAQTSVDILAPQDGVGACLRGISGSSEMFRGYSDAVINFPGRQLWANVETFEFSKTVNSKTGKTKCNTSARAHPASFDRVRQQIEAVIPYVSKIITWIYSDTMAITPALSSWGTPEEVALRAKLRNAYEQYYGGIQPVLTPTPSSGINNPDIPNSIQNIIKKWSRDR